MEVLEEADKLFFDKQGKYEDLEILLQSKKKYIFISFCINYKSLHVILLLV